MDPPTGFFTQIGPQQGRSDHVAGMGFHRERQRRKGRLQKRCIVVIEATASIDCERIDYTCSLRRVAAIAKYE